MDNGSSGSQTDYCMHKPAGTMDSRRRGTGLGVSVSQSPVSKQGGEINVTGKVGGGTAFVATLPVSFFSVGR